MATQARIITVIYFAPSRAYFCFLDGTLILHLVDPNNDFPELAKRGVLAFTLDVELFQQDRKIPDDVTQEERENFERAAAAFFANRVGIVTAIEKNVCARQR